MAPAVPGSRSHGGGSSGGRCRLPDCGRVAENAARQGPEFQLLEEGCQLLGIRCLHHHAVEVRRVRYVRHDGRQLLGQQGLLPELLEVFLLLALELSRGVEQHLHAAILGQKFGRRLGADAGHPGNVVGCVPHEPEQIDDLFRPFDAEALADFCRPPDLRRVAGAARAVHAHLLRDKLAVVLVRCHHVDVEPFLFGQPSEVADHVVRLEAGLRDGGNPHGLGQGVDVGHACLDVLRGLIAVCLVLGKGLVAEGGARRIEHDGQVGGLLVADDVEDGRGESEYGAGVGPLAVDPRVADEGVVGPENQGEGIDEEELLLGFSGQHGTCKLPSLPLGRRRKIPRIQRDLYTGTVLHGSPNIRDFTTG